MDFPSNSQNIVGDNKPSKAEKPKKDVQKVIVGEVVQKQKSLGRRFKDLFVRGEFKGASRYIAAEVLLPALKNMVVDATSKGVERVVYGDVAPRRRGMMTEYGRPRVSYNSPVDRGYSRDQRGRPGSLPDQPAVHPRRRGAANDLILVSREEADLVLERLNDLIDNYDVASVADLNDLVGLPGSYVDNKWGWTNLQYVDVRQVREGYLIDLPSPEPI